jgi:hypothetical protein
VPGQQQQPGQQQPGHQPWSTGQQPAVPPAHQPWNTGQQPAVPGAHQPWSTGQQPAVPAAEAARAPKKARVALPGSVPRLVTTALLVVAGGLAIGGTFGLLERQAQTSGGSKLSLDYTSWKVTESSGVPQTLFFHAPHFGIPLVVAGLLALLGGLLLVLGKGRLAELARPAAIAGAALLVGVVWSMGMTVSSDLDSAHDEADLHYTVTGGIGLWLLLAAGVLAAAGGIMALVALGNDGPGRTGRVEPETPRYGIPALGGPGQPGQTQPGQSQPGQSQPGQSQPGQSQPGQSQHQHLPYQQAAPQQAPQQTGQQSTGTPSFAQQEATQAIRPTSHAQQQPGQSPSDSQTPPSPLDQDAPPSGQDNPPPGSA